MTYVATMKHWVPRAVVAEERLGAKIDASI
jgi:hypothetical protein